MIFVLMLSSISLYVIVLVSCIYSGKWLLIENLFCVVLLVDIVIV